MAATPTLRCTTSPAIAEATGPIPRAPWPWVRTAPYTAPPRLPVTTAFNADRDAARFGRSRRNAPSSLQRLPSQTDGMRRPASGRDATRSQVIDALEYCLLLGSL